MNISELIGSADDPNRRCGPCLRIPQERKCPTCPDLLSSQSGIQVNPDAPYSAEAHYQDLLTRGIVQNRRHFREHFPA